MNFLKELWFGTGICATGDCQTSVEPHGYYCDDCTRHTNALNDNSSQETREKAFVRHNVREWKRLMKKYPNIL